MLPPSLLLQVLAMSLPRPLLLALLLALPLVLALLLLMALPLVTMPPLLLALEPALLMMALLVVHPPLPLLVVPLPLPLLLQVLSPMLVLMPSLAQPSKQALVKLRKLALSTALGTSLLTPQLLVALDLGSALYLPRKAESILGRKKSEL